MADDRFFIMFCPVPTMLFGPPTQVDFMVYDRRADDSSVECLSGTLQPGGSVTLRLGEEEASTIQLDTQTDVEEFGRLFLRLHEMATHLFQEQGIRNAAPGDSSLG